MDFIHPHLSLILFGLLLYKVIRDQSLFIYRRGGGGGGGGGFGGGRGWEDFGGITWYSGGMEGESVVAK